MTLSHKSRTMLSRRSVLAASLLSLVPVSGCGLRGQNRTNQINVLTVQDPFFFGLQQLIPEFERDTGIQVNLEGVDYNTLNARSTNSFLTQQSDIDVISPDSMWLSRFVNSEWLVDLRDLIRRDRAEVKPQDLVPGAIHSLSQWNGGIYTIPAASYGTVVLYRSDVLERLGLSAPPSEVSADWTWDRYLRMVERIDGQRIGDRRLHGTVVSGSGPQPVLHMFSQVAASMGVRWFEAFPDARTWDFTPHLDSPQNLAAVRYFQRLYQLSPPESVNYVWFDAGTAFANGNVGMFYWWTPYAYLVSKSSYMGKSRSSVVGKYEIAALPQQPGVDPVGNVGGYAFGISRYSEKQEAAWTFVKWASSPETQKKMALLPGHMFADFTRRSMYSDPELLEAYPHLPTQLDALESGNGKIPRPPIPNYTTIEGDYGQLLNEVLAGQLTPEQAVTEAQTRVHDLLENELYLPWQQPSRLDTVERTAAILRQLGGAE